MGATLGIDVGKDELVTSLYLNGKRWHRTVKNRTDDFETLVRWLQKHQVGAVHVCMEATGTYWEAIAEYLHAQEYRVSVVNPARIHAYIKSRLSRNKTDKEDADRIAEFCATQQPPAWQPAPAAVRELRSLVRLHEDLRGLLTQANNRLQAGVTSAVVIRMLQAQLALLKQQMTDLEKAMETLIAADAELTRQADLLTSIPGIAKLTAARLLGEHIGVYGSARALVAYAGLNPSAYQSGTSVYRRPRISKLGNARLRKYLFYPAFTALRYNPVIQALGERLKAKQKPQKVTVVAAMRKLLTLAYGVLKSGKPFDPTYAAHAKLPDTVQIEA